MLGNVTDHGWGMVVTLDRGRSTFHRGRGPIHPKTGERGDLGERAAAFQCGQAGRDDAQADGTGAAAGAGVAAPRGVGRGSEADVWVVCRGSFKLTGLFFGELFGLLGSNFPVGHLIIDDSILEINIWDSQTSVFLLSFTNSAITEMNNLGGQITIMIIFLVHSCFVFLQM